MDTGLESYTSNADDSVVSSQAQHCDGDAEQWQDRLENEAQQNCWHYLLMNHTQPASWNISRDEPYHELSWYEH